MKRTISEQKVLHKLGIPDFRHMTKEKVVEFATILPKMDPEVAKAAIAEFPNFKDLSLALVDQYKEVIDAVLHENRAGQEAFYEACNLILETMRNELEQEGLTSEDRDRIETRMIDVAQRLQENISENREFLKSIARNAALTMGFVLALCGALLGANAVLNGEASEEDLDDADAA